MKLSKFTKLRKGQNVQVTKAIRKWFYEHSEYTGEPKLDAAYAMFSANYPGKITDQGVEGAEPKYRLFKIDFGSGFEFETFLENKDIVK